MRLLLLALVWLVPASRLKNALLRSLGHDVHPTARASSCMVWRVASIEMAEHSVMLRWNAIRNINRISLAARAGIGVSNRISSHPVYQTVLPRGATLVLGPDAYITNHHYLDCAGGVEVADFAAIAGRQSTIMTHAIDMRRNAQTAHPITIGARSFVSARVVILGGATLPERSILAAGAVLPPSSSVREPGLWGGVPARRIGDVEGEWFDRDETHTRDIYVPETGEVIQRAF